MPSEYWISDSSLSNHTFTKAGADIGSWNYDDVNYKWVSSAPFVLDDVWLESNDALQSDWCLGTGDWTIDFWMRRDGDAGSEATLYMNGILSTLAYNGVGWSAYIGGNNRIGFYAYAPNYYNIAANASIPNLTWTHVAIVRYGNNISFYYNGVLDSSWSCTGRVFDTLQQLYIGRLLWNYYSYRYHGNLDELRISKVARWSGASFSVPTERYEADADTILLMHFDSAAPIVPTPSDGTVTQLYTTICDLDHLNGRTVAILADGTVLAQQPVIDNCVVLGLRYAKVHVGIPFVADLETLNMEIPSSNGTMQGRRVKVSQLTLRLLNSRGGKIGPNFDTLHSIHYSDILTGGDTLKLISADVKENLGAGFEDGGRMCLRQSDPLPMTLLALIPSITQGGVIGV